jgi:putative ABC transport system permease protein
MGIIWNKIWYDFWHNKSRTLQVVAIVAVGAFAIGMIIHTRYAIITGMEDLWRLGSPMTIGLAVDPPVDDDQILALKRIRGVEDVEGKMQTTVEWRLGPDQPWKTGTLSARADYQRQVYGTLDLTAGSWPSGKTAAVCQGVDTAFGVHVGDSVIVRLRDREHTLDITGAVYDNYAQPPGFGGSLQLYVDRDRYDYITGEYDFNLIMAGMAPYEEEQARALANEMQRRLEAAGVNVEGATPPEGNRYVDPRKHFFQDFMDAIFLVMGILGGLALVLGLFLVYNTINAIVSQQVGQIGIMKAIGARTRDIVMIYLTSVLMYGVLAMILAIPLSVLAGTAMTNALMASFNAAPVGIQLWPIALVAQVAISLLAPVLAALIPVISGALLTVREAISTYGLSAEASRLDRWLAKIEQLPRSLALTVSNTFRHRGRVILTQITLVVSGLIFMMIVAVSDSVNYTFNDVVFSILNFNVTLLFQNTERIERIEQITRAFPEVKAVEMWAWSGGKIRPADQPESDDDINCALMGVPLPTRLYGYQLRAGRWLQPGDTYAAVLNEKLAADAGVGVGDWVTFDLGIKGESRWEIVGLTFDPILTTVALVPRETLLRQIKQVGRAQAVWIQTMREDPAGELEAAKRLRQYYEALHYKLSPGSVFGTLGDTASGIAAFIIGQFTFIILLLMVMAVVIGVVGSIALSGVLSLNVLERRREIGVMRAIGASSASISGLFIGEGLILGWLSWLIAAPLSLPAGQLMLGGLASALNLGLVYHYTPRGAVLWLVIITVLSVMASYFPARGATRISVQESLAYQ